MSAHSVQCRDQSAMPVGVVGVGLQQTLGEIDHGGVVAAAGGVVGERAERGGVGRT
jgi:hypothetical protein